MENLSFFSDLQIRQCSCESLKRLRCRSEHHNEEEEDDDHDDDVVMMVMMIKMMKRMCPRSVAAALDRDAAGTCQRADGVRSAVLRSRVTLSETRSSGAEGNQI